MEKPMVVLQVWKTTRPFSFLYRNKQITAKNKSTLESITIFWRKLLFDWDVLPMLKVKVSLSVKLLLLRWASMGLVFPTKISKGDDLAQHRLGKKGSNFPKKQKVKQFYSFQSRKRKKTFPTQISLRICPQLVYCTLDWSRNTRERGDLEPLLCQRSSFSCFSASKTDKRISLGSHRDLWSKIRCHFLCW